MPAPNTGGGEDNFVENEKYVIPHEFFNNYARDVPHDFFVKLHDIMIDHYNALLFGGGEVFMIWSSR